MTVLINSYIQLTKPSIMLLVLAGGLTGVIMEGGLTAEPLKLSLFFLIIFFWTPPHFRSLAIRFRDDYRTARLPMLPLVKGRQSTLTQIHYYTLALFGVSLLPLTVNFGWFYPTAASMPGLVFIGKTYIARKTQDIDKIWSVFKYSIVY